jgi:hypothetical protein
VRKPELVPYYSAARNLLEKFQRIEVLQCVPESHGVGMHLWTPWQNWRQR